MLQKFGLFLCASSALALSGCVTQLCVNMKLASTSSNIQLTNDFSKDTRVEQLTTFYLMGFPLGDESTPQAAFGKLNQDADYINNLELSSSFWHFSLPVSEDFSIGISKESWKAKGTVVKNK